MQYMQNIQSLTDFENCFYKLNELISKSETLNSFEFQCKKIRFNLFINQLKSILGTLAAGLTEIEFFNCKNKIIFCEENYKKFVSNQVTNALPENLSRIGNSYFNQRKSNVNLLKFNIYMVK